MSWRSLRSAVKLRPWVLSAPVASLARSSMKERFRRRDKAGDKAPEGQFCSAERDAEGNPQKKRVRGQAT